jgi:4-hydroxy-tetrahydrodipicolinate reductase
MLSLSILGAAGRMGQKLVACSRDFPELRIAAAIERDGHPALGRDAGLLAGIDAIGVPLSTAAQAAPADVTIDFTFHAATPGNLAAALASGAKGYVLGTTALSPGEKAAVEKAAETIPVVWAPNFSLGVNLLLSLARQAGALLDGSYDVEIVEMHHRHKKDAPSGTALGLAEAVAAGRGIALDEAACYGRQGVVGERPAGQIAIHALRGGDVVGDHTVIFAAEGERIEIPHTASDRAAFARGALRAAAWVANRPPRIYAMAEVLRLP